MNSEHDDRIEPTSKPLPRGNASESLNDALDDLEDMLDIHDGEGARGSDADGSPEAGGLDAVTDDGQYSIPLLNDIVTAPPAFVATEATTSAIDDDYSEAVQRMAERLSSEIDVIVQSAVDEAIEKLRGDIGERLREHLDITLPEVLEELVQLRRR